MENLQGASFNKRNNPSELPSREKEKPLKWGPKFMQGTVGFGQDEDGFMVEYREGKWYIDTQEITEEEMLEAIGPNAQRLMEKDESFRKLVNKDYH